MDHHDSIVHWILSVQRQPEVVTRDKEPTNYSLITVFSSLSKFSSWERRAMKGRDPVMVYNFLWHSLAPEWLSLNAVETS